MSHKCWFGIVVNSQPEYEFYSQSPVESSKYLGYILKIWHCCDLQAISEVLKQPSAIWTLAEINDEDQELTQRLQTDIARCNAADLVYSPQATLGRHEAGMNMCLNFQFKSK